MNILFLKLSKIDNISSSRGIYIDLMRKFSKEGHSLFIVSSMERRFNGKTQLIEDYNTKFLNVRTLNLRKTNFIEKGIGILLLEYQYKKAILKYFPNIKFDLILYTTPPITFTSIIRYFKEKDNAVSYLLLKDIFPQNAVDLGIIRKNSLFHNFFRKKEIKLYNISDYIGCMSPKNVEYIKKHNPQLPEKKIEVCPNSIEIIENTNEEVKSTIRQNYNIPEKAVVFIFGGNLGKPQGLDFLHNVLLSNNGLTDRFFAIVGAGTERAKIEKWFSSDKYTNALLLPILPKKEYDLFIKCADIGLIFLSRKFTIPNYPSRLLVYLENKMPILAAIDLNTDIGDIAVKNKYGFWCENGDIHTFNKYVDFYCQQPEERKQMGLNGNQFLKNNYTVDNTYNTIINHFK